MPIDFARVADTFRDPLTRQTDPLLEVFERLARTVRTLQRLVDDADHATRALPLVPFRDGALSVRVVRAVASDAVGPPAIVEDASCGGAAFAAGVRWIGTAINQELLLPNLGRVAADLAARIEADTNRVLDLSPSMFDIGPSTRSLFELPALAALGVRAAADAGAVRERPRPGDPARPSAGTSPTLPNLDQLPDLLAGTTSAIVLALPTMTVALSTRTRILSLAARVAVVDRLTEAEAALLGIRSSVSEIVLAAAGPAEIAARWLSPIDLLVRIDLVRITTWLPVAAGEILTGVRRVVDGVNDSTRSLVTILDTVIGIIESITSINLLAGVSLVLVQLGLPPARLTIGDLINEATVAYARLKALELATNLEALALLSLPVSDRDYRIWSGLAAMFAVLAAHDIGTISISPVPPTITALPDFVGRLFPPSFDRAIEDWARGTVDGVRVAVGGAIRESGILATRLDESVQAIAAESRRGLGGIVPAQAAAAAARFTDAAIGDEVVRQRESAAERSADAGADPFLHLFFTTGFQLAGGLVPHYLAGLQRFLRRRELRPTPTSPHVLARHGRLVGVRTERVTVRATCRPTDAATATETGDRLRGAIGDLYLTGRRRLDEVATEARPPLRPPTRRRR